MIKKVFSFILATTLIASVLAKPIQSVQAAETTEIDEEIVVSNEDLTQNNEENNQESLNPEKDRVLLQLIGVNPAPEIISSNTGSGLSHPGVGLTKEVITNLQKQIRAGAEPWKSYFLGMAKSKYADPKYLSTVDKDGDGLPSITSITLGNQWENYAEPDAKAAYTLALMYVITGDESYRAKSLKLLREWQNVSAVSTFRDWIKSSLPVYFFASAAELLKYSSCDNQSLKWTEEDDNGFKAFLYKCLVYNIMDQQYMDSETGKFSKLELNKTIWMNQHGFAMLEAMSIYLFMDDAKGYADVVEKVTKNADTTRPWLSGSIDMMARDVGDEKYQLTEMGRDQIHAHDNIEVLSIMCQMMYEQGTRVDPTAGTISKKANSVNAYEFMGSKLLFATDYWCQYNLGYNPVWKPIRVDLHDMTKDRKINLHYDQWYTYISNQCRGAIQNIGYLYYFYKYMADNKIDLNIKAPYLVEYFKHRYDPTDSTFWNSQGSDYWLHIPANAANDENNKKYTVKKNEQDVIADEVREIEAAYTAIDKSKASIITNGNDKYVQMNADNVGTTIAMLDNNFRLYRLKEGKCLVSIKFKSNGEAKLNLKQDSYRDPFASIQLPNTNGEWKYVDVDLNTDSVPFGLLREDIPILYLQVIGNGAVVDLDNLAINRKQGIAPSFGIKDKNIYSYVGGNVGISLSAKNDENLKYLLLDAPAGADIDSSGNLTWIPDKAGTYKFYVEAQNNTSVATLPVTIIVKDSSLAAANAILEEYDNIQGDYTSSSFDAFKQKKDEAMAVINNNLSTPLKIGEALMNVKDGADSLQLLTPLMSETLKDGTKLTSVNYPSIATSNLQKAWFNNLIDGDPDTFNGSFSTTTGDVTIDFGKDYKLKVSAFWMQNRIYFPERTDAIIVYASNNGINWDVITDKDSIRYNDDLQATGNLEGLHKVPVLEKYKNNYYRYFKVANGQSAGMFSVSELRIEGERVEATSTINNTNDSINSITANS